MSVFLVTRAGVDGRSVLTLYADGSEPDTAIYDAVRALPHDHVPEIFDVGRWQERAYEVSEEITGTSLSAAGLDGKDIAVVHRVIFELGGALSAFGNIGLRHRDIQPGNVLVRTTSPLDLVITGFGSARLSDYDLDVVAPLETTRYMAPEAIAGGVASASDWWSLGMITLELVTAGACFEGVNQQAFLIHVLTNGVPIPSDLEPSVAILLKGLLARDHRTRWQWNEVRGWLAGDDVELPPEALRETPDSAGKANISLAGKLFTKASTYSLAAAEAANWDEARQQVARGVLATWVDDAGFDPQIQSAIRRLSHAEGLSDDFRLSVALKILHPAMPLVVKGNIVTPGWLLDHPDEATQLIFGAATDALKRLGAEEWLFNLKKRGEAVRIKAKQFSIALNEEDLKVHLLSTSKARLAALWADRRRFLPDTDHPGLNSLIERRQTAEDDFILLLSAEVGQFRSVDEILDEAKSTADRAGVPRFRADEAGKFLDLARRDIHRLVDERLLGFSRCGIPKVDEWADQFRLDRRIELSRALVLLSVPKEQWKEPPKQAYIATLLEFFSKKISGSILRGPLTRMAIGKTTPRVDLIELGTERRPAPALLDHVLARSDHTVDVDPAAFAEEAMLDRRTRSLHSHSTLYKRDTGIDGMYLGFPFLLQRDGRGNTKTKIAPVLLWPVKLVPEVGNRGHVSLAFDRDREEVRVNPAFEGMMGIDATRRWQEAANDLLGRTTLTASDVIDGFGTLAEARGRTLVKLPGKDAEAEPGRDRIVCAAVLFHLAYMGQAIVEDLKQLQSRPLTGSGLETALKVTEAEVQSPPMQDAPELDRFFTVASDPSQEAAVLEARSAPGLLVEGPPGTGKSQTIVNMVADAIGRKKSLLVVCQKQAALEVVKKRLEAEGLENRIFMVTDMNRDREPILLAIREQLETLHNQAPNSNPPWKRDRERLAARIETLEGDLDRHHAALHEADQATGLSYRNILSELIEIERGDQRAIDLPALRRTFAELDPGDVAALEAECVPLVRSWLPARFEDNPLSVLKVFNPDDATASAFRDDMKVFVESERERLAVLDRTAKALPVSEPQAFAQWYASYDDQFRNLDADERAELARWLPRMNTSASGSLINLNEDLATIAVGLGGISGAAPSENLSAITVGLSDHELENRSQLARSVIKPASIFGRLSPARWLRSRRMKAFATENGLDANDHLPFIAAASWEQQLRPLREEMTRRLSEVNEEAMVTPQLRADELRAIAVHRSDALAKVKKLSGIVSEFPNRPLLEKVIATASPDAYELVKEAAEQALERFEARQFSRAALSNLAQWYEEAWVATRLSAIDTDASNEPAVERIRDGYSTLLHYQRFRIRSSGLSNRAWELFRILRSKSAELANVDPDRLEDETGRLIQREARLAWKARIESQRPTLLNEFAELQSKIKAIDEADRNMRAANRKLLTHGVDMSRVAPSREWEPYTRLRGQRARRLREFMENATGLGLMELRPVWLMNPDVASRVLPLTKGLFDIVIYDEASQMPVEFALPTLFRGQVVVVSGDEKQMPPTAFFSSKVENDEADVFDGEDIEDDATEVERETHTETWNRREIKDCPDLLQLAKTVLPTTTLQIHYRSTFRELIGFSNASFYGGRLNVPVRHPDAEVTRAKPIEVIRADGVYENQTNAIEAQRVVEALADVWNAGGKTPTVGVVTFNRKQADLIEEVLEEHAEKDPWFRGMLTRERERIEGGEGCQLLREKR
jgi:primosomal replication protein N''